ncbi:MAG: hypothetical protein ABIG88_01325 [Patescibacteria group bacterium]|nr:hypothetical protein [Patescibacteria group bacterium]
MITKEQYKEIYDKFITSSQTKEDVYMLMLGIGINWNKVRKIMNHLYPWFWDDNCIAIIKTLFRDDIIIKEQYILGIIRNWLYQAWRNDKYEFKNKWSESSIKELFL